MELPHLKPAAWPDDLSQARFGSLIRTDPGGCRIALIGMPDDTGISMNNGRPGAAEGPGALRGVLSRYGVADPLGWEWPGVFDAGDVDVVPGDLHATHRRVTEAVEAVVDLGLLPIGIGGGHDLSFPFVRGVANRTGPMAGVYFDPHLDVRETDGSGMPFRRLLETGAAKSMRIHGFDAMSNSREHVRWFQAHGGRIDHTADPGDQWPAGPCFVSLDLDVIDAAYAPGVSAMNPMGWSPELAARWIHAAGANSEVKCFDIMELSPPNDHAGRTARLAARLLLTFLKGFSERTS
ncbi:MAG: arginase family protein [Phycisphaerales bacterium]